MITLTLTPLSCSTLLSLKKPATAFPFNLKPLHYPHNRKKKVKSGICKAEFSQDAPFAIAIGTCMLSSLVLATPPSKEEDADTVLDSTDTRFAVMGIISFIPYFNWLSWVFSWLDTGKRRYAVYSLVYLVPYLRSNLSLSPEESWLPIASIVCCIVHIQLEISIRNGDLQGFQLLSKASEYISSRTRNKDNYWERQQENSKQKAGEREDIKLPSAEEQSGNELRQWGVPRKPSEHQEQMNGDSNDDESTH